MSEVVVLDFWVSPFCMRVKIALEEKGVTYQSIEEKNLLGGKSDLLLKSNPIYQKVPVLLHKESPVCESTVIVGYIEETWAAPSLLPPCAYDRAQARFWADYIDKKLFDAIRDVALSKGEATEVAKKELIEILKVLEGALGDKDFFVGESFGYVDVLAIPLTSWIWTSEKLGNFKVEDVCPKFSAWMKRCSKRESVAKILPDPEKVYEFVLMLRKMHGID